MSYKSYKSNWLIEFTDITDDEVKSILKIIRNPTNKDDINHGMDFVCVVISLFYRMTKDKNFMTNMRVSVG